MQVGVVITGRASFVSGGRNVVPSGRAEVQRVSEQNARKADRRTKPAYTLGAIAMWSFGMGVVFIAVWAIVSIV
jgi:hypothetical protein